MPKKPRLVPISTPPANDQQARLIAHDQASHRFILAVGAQRTAYDFSVRATPLPPTTGTISDRGDYPILDVIQSLSRMQTLPPDQQQAELKKFASTHPGDAPRAYFGRAIDG